MSSEGARRSLENADLAIKLEEQVRATDDPRVVPLARFVGVDEPGAEALLGEGESALIPEGGDVMLYGDGGAGKTTLAVDLAFHLAAGKAWLGFEVPQKLRVLIVENEGPRPHFRVKLRRKVANWTGKPLGDRIHILEQPWPWLTLDDADHRGWLAATIDMLGFDVVIVGPVTRSGMNEAGTLQEVRDFQAHLDNVRLHVGRPVAFVLVHHENKSGQVSGAWEGCGDTLLHVQGQGHGRTRLYIQKARWASAHHATSLQLVWTDGEGFALDDVARDDDTIADELLEAALANGGASWNAIEKGIDGKRERKRQVRDRLLAGGRLVDTGGKAGMKLWHVDDPARPTVQEQLSPDGDSPGTHPESRPGETAGEATESLSPYVSRTQGSGTHSVPPSETEGHAA